MWIEHTGHPTFHESPKKPCVFLTLGLFVLPGMFFPGGLLLIFHKSSQMPFSQWILSECLQAELDYLTWSSHGSYKVNIFNIVLIAVRLSSYTCVCPHGWQVQSLIILIINMCHRCIWNRWMSLILDEEKPRILVVFTDKLLVMRGSLPCLLSCIWDPVFRV